MTGSERASFARSQKLGLRITVALVLAVIVYLAMALWAGWDNLAVHLKTFPLKWFALAIALATGNFLVRFVRYDLLLRSAGVRVPLFRNLLIHFAGLALTMTPGKVGEAIKSWFLHILGHDATVTLPVVFMERFSDLFSVLLLAALGVFTLGLGITVFALSAAFLLALFLLVATSRGMHLLSALAAKLPLVRRRLDTVKRLLEGVRQFMTPRTLAMTLLTGALGWGAEAVAFYFVAHGAGLDVSPFYALFVYSISTLAGVVFPGGLGGMEGMMGLLLARSGSPGAVVTAIFLIRLATLWWATLAGTFALAAAGATIRSSK